jgi:hypothetical protein
MPISLLRNPSQWTVEIHGNISITIALFIVRSVSYLLHRDLPQTGAVLTVQIIMVPRCRAG